ncbi:uncharacterized protein LOC117578769 [Drosophila guanche]|uniref:uncharacterized protein LOC117578769 n=1 Tax=Drosophila guanche TaxID=7266 RepID=UPI00147099A4|nr:uncharacterized protein LOC117578769 [Drosophila guanche]XP_034120377.1 uncharacterized protein LOC117578769 [Drosophila guanche]XP_034120385.1 uncharacterized protein LOC117578769 [Drosophila guanche]
MKMTDCGSTLLGIIFLALQLEGDTKVIHQRMKKESRRGDLNATFSQTLPHAAINITEVGLEKTQPTSTRRTVRIMLVQRVSLIQKGSGKAAGPWMTWHIVDYGLRNSSGNQ